MNNKLINYLLNYFNFDDEIETVTLVGSIEEKKISEVSDIDIVIITKKLTKDLYEKIINHGKNVNLKSIGIDINTKIN